MSLKLKQAVGIDGIAVSLIQDMIGHQRRQGLNNYIDADMRSFVINSIILWLVTADLGKLSRSRCLWCNWNWIEADNQGHENHNSYENFINLPELITFWIPERCVFALRAEKFDVCLFLSPRNDSCKRWVCPIDRAEGRSSPASNVTLPPSRPSQTPLC